VDIIGITDALISHALASGMFSNVSGFEPKSAPGTGLTAALWLDSLTPIPAASGLSATAARLTFRLRIYTSMLSEPQDAIDPEVLTATQVLIVAYSGDFTLGGLVRNVDLLGAHGQSLSAQAGYLNQDGRLMRVMDLTIPLVINDIATQAP